MLGNVKFISRFTSEISCSTLEINFIFPIIHMSKNAPIPSQK